MHFLQAINSDLSVLIVSNKTGGTIKRDIKKINEKFVATCWLFTSLLVFLSKQTTSAFRPASSHNRFITFSKLRDYLNTLNTNQNKPSQQYPFDRLTFNDHTSY